jgi:hypothetical protein
MFKRLKISHHKHSGKLRPHEYTSYGPLLVLLVVVGVALGVCTVAASPTDNLPKAGSVGLTGTMPGKPPTVAATISSPTNNQRFSTTPITVKGTCPQNTLVELYKNDIFAGSTTCDDSGNYTLEIDLLIGENKLIARVYDSLGQAGPDSQTVTVFYDALPAQTSSLAPLNFGSGQLLLNTDAVFRGTFPGQEMAVPISIIGGTPPYAVNIQWGDGSNRVEPRSDALKFNALHTYKRAGTYQIVIQATDSQGRVAFLTVAVIVNGQPAAAIGSTSKPASSKVLLLWPIFTAAAAAVISFWLGERREKRILLRPTVVMHA